METPNPNINVRFNSENGESLADNGSKILGSFIKETEITFSLLIFNTGDTGSILSIPKNGITFVDSGTITNNPSADGPIDILQGSNSVEFKIKIDSLVIGSKSVKISIISNDQSNTNYNHIFFFTIIQPSILNPDIAIVYSNVQVQTNSVVYFGSFPKDVISDISFQIFNYAVPDLIIPQSGISITTIGSNESIIVNPVTSSSVTLSFNSSSIFKIRLDNSSIGNKSAVVLITSNDPDENPFVFTVSYYVAKPFDLIVKESLTEVFDGEAVSLGSFNNKSIISRSINMSNRGISYGIKLLNISGDGDVILTNIPSLPHVLQPNEANAVQFIAKFGSSVIGKRTASLKIQWEVSTS